MDDLDFSELNDDQLEALFRAVCAEAIRRGPAVAAAVRQAGFDATEQARVANEAAEREAERIRMEEERRVAEQAAARVRDAAATARQDTIWGRKKALAERVRALYHIVAGYDGWDMKGCELQVWKSGVGSETRVFLGKGYGKGHVTLFVTGNKRQPPGSLEFGDRDFKPHADAVKQLLADAYAAFPAGTKIDIHMALSVEVSP